MHIASNNFSSEFSTSLILKILKQTKYIWQEKNYPLLLLMLNVGFDSVISSLCVAPDTV